MTVTIIAILCYFLHWGISAQESRDKHRCIHKLSGKLVHVCCSGYRLWNEQCIECFGAFGENCSVPCGQNTFGYRCRRICNCTDNQVCDRYTGCMERDVNQQRHQVVISLIIGLGLAMVTASVVFVGVMFCKWRRQIQQRFKQEEEQMTGFQVDLLSFPGKEEEHTETYDDVRESKMTLHGGNSGTRDTGEYRINSTDYNQLFSDKNALKKNINEGNQYCYIDARFQRDDMLLTLSEYPEDECYVSVSRNNNRLRRISKSCSDMKAILTKPYINIISSHNAKSTTDNLDRVVLIEHL
ncbi:uncharacterized protein LOC125647361 isoform X1 [Ostrea edulis]|uniref:uncharacterized protein LOC125647361 isoform X1 n=1 Tax=Ostrea edulis TaxID=37623 RepID=UPI0024AED5BC|nr:uncharacterized protein LOC125647361 isoform X1 [Ostrea edulis]